MIQKNSYTNKDLLKSGNGTLFGPNTGKMPQSQMLMVQGELSLSPKFRSISLFEDKLLD